MIYVYQCNGCTHNFDVVKPVKEIDNKENCPICKSDDTRRTIIGGTGFYGADDWDTAGYDPAFGKVIRNRKHREAEAKSRGWEEVGNEPPEKLHKWHDERLQDNLNATWKDA